MNSTASVNITVNSPDNHFNPQLDQLTYTGNLDENSVTGTTILTFSATDADVMGPASDVNFYLGGTNSNFFYIENFDNNTALLRAK